MKKEEPGVKGLEKDLKIGEEEEKIESARDEDGVEEGNLIIISFYLGERDEGSLEFDSLCNAHGDDFAG